MYEGVGEREFVVRREQCYVQKRYERGQECDSRREKSGRGLEQERGRVRVCMKEETDRQQSQQLEQTSTAYIPTTHIHADTLHLNIDAYILHIDTLHLNIDAYILHIDTLHLNIDEVFSFLNGIHVGMEDGLLCWHTS